MLDVDEEASARTKIGCIFASDWLPHVYFNYFISSVWSPVAFNFSPVGRYLLAKCRKIHQISDEFGGQKGREITHLWVLVGC